MLKRQAYQFRIRLNGEQRRMLRCAAGACRYANNNNNNNNMLALQKKALCRKKHYAEQGKKLTYADCCKQLTAWRKNEKMGWFTEVPSQALQQAIKDLDRAYQNFFEKRAHFPKFKRKGRSDSFRYPQGIKLDQGNSRIFLPKVGWVRYRNSQAVLGDIKNVTVSSKIGHWFVSIQTEQEVEQPSPVSTQEVGIDVGIQRFATLSDGSFIEPINSHKKLMKCLAKRQKQLSRKVKFSKNWRKIVTHIQKLHDRIRNSSTELFAPTHPCTNEVRVQPFVIL